MMLSRSTISLLLPLATLLLVLPTTQAHPAQHAFTPSPPPPSDVPSESHILSILSLHEDPVDAMLALDPSLASQLAEPRFLQVMEGDETSSWMTEGDKMRLRRRNLDFIDWTGRHDLVDPDHQAEASE